MKFSVFVPDRVQKLAVIRDLVYEYGNFMTAAYFDLNGESPWRTNCDDAFLLGCRKLGDFLMKDVRQQDDVLAMDYLPPHTPRKWDVPIWSKWKEDMGKYLAHITYRRTEDRPAEGLLHWDHAVWVPQLRVEFNKAWWDFREAVIDGEFCAEFDKQLRDCKAKPGFDKVNLNRLL